MMLTGRSRYQGSCSLWLVHFPMRNAAIVDVG